VTLALQWTLAEAALTSPGFPDEGVTVLAVLAGNGATLIHLLQRKQTTPIAVR